MGVRIIRAILYRRLNLGPLFWETTIGGRPPQAILRHQQVYQSRSCGVAANELGSRCENLDV